MIEVRNLTVHVPGFRLHSIDLNVGPEDFFALIGPTGSGKSLLLEAMAGLVPIKAGRILVNGEDIGARSPERRGLGLVYQDHALFPHLSVRENILFGVRYHGLDRSTAHSRFNGLVHRLDLGPILDRSTTHLSGGERQRTALARSLMLQPRALLLDEPLSALDPVFRDDIRRLLRSLHEELAIPFILVSHDFSEVQYLANRGAILHEGIIEQNGAVRSLFERPVNRFCARFVGMKNLVACHVQDGWARVDALKIRIPRPLKWEGPAYLAIRPEDIGPADEGGRICDNEFTARVTALDGQGFIFHVSLEVEGVSLAAFWTRRTVDRRHVRPGHDILIHIPSDAVHVLCPEGAEDADS